MRTEEDTQNFDDWLQSYSARRTRQTYYNGLRTFLQKTYKSTDKAEVLAPRYVRDVADGKQDAFRDLVAFTNAMADRPPKSVKLWVAATRQFLVSCTNVEFSERQRSVLKRKMKSSRARTREDFLTRDTLKQILLHLDVRMRALVLVLVASGIRVGEALQLRISDVRLDGLKFNGQKRPIGNAKRKADFPISVP